MQTGTCHSWARPCHKSGHRSHGALSTPLEELGDQPGCDLVVGRFHTTRRGRSAGTPTEELKAVILSNRT